MQDMIPQGFPGPHDGAGHETSDVGIRGILIAGFILTLVIIAVMVLLGGWYAAMSYRERQALAQRPPRFADDTGQFPEPRLQGSPLADMVIHRDREQARLASYGWVDQQAGIAHIPIERAIELAPAVVLRSEQPGDAPAVTPGPEAEATAPDAPPPTEPEDGAATPAAPLPEDVFQDSPATPAPR